MSKNSKKFMSEMIGKSKLDILFLAILQGIIGFIEVGYALLLKDIVNSAVEGNKSAFKFTIILFVAAVLINIFLQAVFRWREELTKATIENRIKGYMFSTLLYGRYEKINNVHSGEWMNRITSDTSIIANGVTMVIPGVIGMVIRLLTSIFIILQLEPIFCCLVIPVGIFLFLSSHVFRKRLKSLNKNIQEKDGLARSYIQEIIESMLVVRSYAVEENVLSEGYDRMKNHKKARMERNWFHNLCNIGFSAVMNGAFVVGAIFCGWGMITNRISYGSFVAVLRIVEEVQNPFANISGYFPQWFSIIASAERLNDAANEVEVQKRNSLLSIEQIMKIYNTEFKGISIENASFSYDSFGKSAEEEYVIRNISIKIHKGEYIAFSGESGCGKSTIMKLLLSLYKLNSGEIVIETETEKHILNNSWQNLYAYVPQGNYLMSGTIRDIISLAAPEDKDNDERIRYSLQVACADTFVSELENNIETVLGERGSGLSEGQMQRIAIARAVFSEHPIILLDESTSALDSNTEEKILSNLKNMTNKTVIIITHRPSTFNICDRIIFFTANGSLREEKRCPVTIN